LFFQSTLLNLEKKNKPRNKIKKTKRTRNQNYK